MTRSRSSPRASGRSQDGLPRRVASRATTRARNRVGLQCGELVLGRFAVDLGVDIQVELPWRERVGVGVPVTFLRWIARRTRGASSKSAGVKPFRCRRRLGRTKAGNLSPPCRQPNDGNVDIGISGVAVPHYRPRASSTTEHTPHVWGSIIPHRERGSPAAGVILCGQVYRPAVSDGPARHAWRGRMLISLPGRQGEPGHERPREPVIHWPWSTTRRSFAKASVPSSNGARPRRRRRGADRRALGESRSRPGSSSPTSRCRH